MENGKDLIDKFKNMIPEGGFWENGEFILSKEEEISFQNLHRDIVRIFRHGSPTYKEFGEPNYRTRVTKFSVCGW